ncbi:MAG: molybdate ABC transporter substrate-binding protein, partial [Cyanobacteria bacterium NC_groundwater_1444_Ag_S-0.65um_54_12]|nr:molybdate ABC transporter substrate-binding protein [Cyanobacteria bacterium NC_groundwater_1444_Ag_S-0.65um_54_12]
MMRHSFLGISLLLLLATAALAKETWLTTPALRILAASDLRYALPELLEVYEATAQIPVSVVYGSSGKFFAQLMNGLPADIFFSADSQYPYRLEKTGMAMPGSRFTYAVGQLALCSANTATIDVTKGMAVLSESKVTKIAIANPQHAPYGKAALEALHYYQLYPQVKERLVFGESVLQAFQYLASGAAPVGIVAFSLLSTARIPRDRSWLIPQKAYRPILQEVLILKSVKQPLVAKNFLGFVKSRHGKQILARHGFGVQLASPTLPGAS